MISPSALIIEDDHKQRDIFSLVLKTSFDIETCADGRAALSRLDMVTPSLILLDLHLPHIPGADILHQIRNNKRFAKTRVVVISADVPTADSLKDEADLVLHKPVSIRQLQELANLTAT